MNKKKVPATLKTTSFFRKLVLISIVFIYLIIIAGAIVRMTGSGMGCPDWPKCFGYYIPPTQETQIQWQPNHTYRKGTIVIKDKNLRIAKNDFISTATYDRSLWDPYTKHDYAKFNVWHTWIEYINRLVTVLSGIPILLMCLFSFRYWKTKKNIPLLAVLTIIAMGFQAWLGKIVVDSNLLPVRITVHMLVAFLILAILLAILHQSKDNINAIKVLQSFRTLLLIATVLTLIQVGLGTQVRQYVDEQLKSFENLAKSRWLIPVPLSFYIHRSFSVLVFLVNGWLFFKYKRSGLYLPKLDWVIILILIEILTGILMFYFDFPMLSQPTHLVIAALLFGVQFYLLLETESVKNKLSLTNNSP